MFMLSRIAHNESQHFIISKLVYFAVLVTLFIYNAIFLKHSKNDWKTFWDYNKDVPKTQKNGTFLRCFENNVLETIEIWNIYKRFTNISVVYEISAYKC